MLRENIPGYIEFGIGAGSYHKASSEIAKNIYIEYPGLGHRILIPIFEDAFYKLQLVAQKYCRMQWYQKHVRATYIEYCGLAFPAWGGGTPL